MGRSKLPSDSTISRNSELTFFVLKRSIGSAKFTAKTLASGDELKVGGKEIELDSEITAEE
jgi:hypothetical protein